MFAIPPLVVAEAMAREHMTDLRMQAVARQGSGPGGRSGRSVKTSAGWFLVNVGLHLAVTRPSVPEVSR